MAQSTTVKHLNPLRLEFSFFDPEEIKSLSVVKVSVPISFNALGLPYKNGLYDPAMGPLSERGDICTTCHCPFFTCSGHFGHIELPLPVFNPLFLKSVLEVLKLVCLNCYEIQIPEHIRKVLISQMRFLRAGCLVEAQQLSVNLARELISNEEQLKDSDIEQSKEILRNVQKTEADIENSLLNPEDAKNIEVLRAHYWSLVREQFKVSPTCCDCHMPITKINLVRNKLMTSLLKEQSEEDKVVFHAEPTFITPVEAQNHLRELWSRHSDFIIALVPVLLNVKRQHPTDIFFIEVTAVPPPKVRPVTFIRDKINEHPQTLVYQQVLEHCVITQQVARIAHGGNVEDLGEENRIFYEGISGESPTEKLHHAWQGLQTAVDNLVDSELSSNGKLLRASAAGLKQVISKKEGLIRMHMMGKRVNFAGRTVITPDPNLGVDEIGIPEAFAKVLTFPTPVTTWNVAVLREAVQNGPNIYPGANAVQLENGQTSRVSKDSATQRASLAKRLLTPANAAQNASVGDNCLKPPKVVLRHLQNGDVLLLNRQPTLHRPSIMAHRARVLKGEKTFRMHYANCKAYNADFDGDEMNAHFPQSEVSRAESYFLAEVARQYLVPKDGTPLSGLIQDHVVAGVRLSVRGRFFSRADFCALLQRAMPTLGARALLPRPALLRPRRLWSGKQLLSTVLLNCLPPGRQPPSLCDVSKISASAWTTPAAARQWRAGGSPLRGVTMSEAEVIIREGELLCGVLDKKHFGSTPYGLCHCLYELYGGECCISFLSALGRLFTAFLQSEGFTLGVRDILVIPEANETRKQILEETRTSGPSAISKALDLPLPLQTENQIYQGGILPPGAEVSLARIAAGDLRLRAALDRAYKQQLDPASDAVSKACLPAGLVERFPLNNLQLMVQSGAKGSTVNTLQISCLLGQIELEGKRPPLLASGKALPSFCRFEPSPRAGGFVADRFLTGIRPQEFFYHCMAGREGLIDTAVKTSRSGYLQRCLIKHLEGLVVAYDGTVRDSDGSVVQFAYGEDGLDVLRAQFLKERQLPILADNYKAFWDEKAIEYLMADSDTEEIEKAHKEVRHWRRRQKRKLKGGIRSLERTGGVWVRTPEPVAARVYPTARVHALTEHIDTLIGEYIKRHKGTEVEDVGSALRLRATLAYADAGEPVGLLAAQSIGEPSTQMTLNTFHFAGRGEMNVTLGIPRLREVLMLASHNPRTPSMEAPAIGAPAALDRLRRRLRRSRLVELLQDATVHEWLDISGSKRLRCYRVRLQLLPAHLLLCEHSVSTKRVLEHIENKFLAQLFAELRRYWRTSALLDSDTLGPMGKEGRSRQANMMEPEDDVDDPAIVGSDFRQNARHPEDSESSSENEGDDDDATQRRYKLRRAESCEYDNEDFDEEAGEDGVGADAEEDNGSVDRQSLGKMEQMDSMENTEVDPAPPTSKNKKFTKDTEHNHQKRIKEVLNRYVMVVSYTFDHKDEQWCEVTLGLSLTFTRIDLSSLLRHVAEQSVVTETPGIKQAFVDTNSDGTVMLRTEGCNLTALFKYADLLDLKRLYSNDVHAMALTYGIEAARAVLVREVRDVFRAYGITVDPRHLLLVADYMTFLGSYEPLSRRGMEAGCSPLQQMSFESSLTFVQSAALRGRRDALRSPSSRLMLGRPCALGTGIFTLHPSLSLPA